MVTHIERHSLNGRRGHREREEELAFPFPGHVLFTIVLIALAIGSVATVALAGRFS